MTTPRRLQPLYSAEFGARRAGLSEGATALYRAVLDQSCVALISVLHRLPEFQPRALSELLSRTASLTDDIGPVLERLPRTSLDARHGRQHDIAFRRRYLELASSELDKLDLFGVDTHHYRPRTRVRVAYFSLTVTGGARGARQDWRDEDWFSNRREGDTTQTGGVPDGCRGPNTGPDAGRLGAPPTGRERCAAGRRRG